MTDCCSEFPRQQKTVHLMNLQGTVCFHVGWNKQQLAFWEEIRGGSYLGDSCGFPENAWLVETGSSL